MSVQTEIDRIINAVDAAHTKVAEKGGTTARPYLVGNLADAIASIPASADPVLQSKTVSPSTSAQTVKPDSGYDGLSQVTVNAMTTATQATPSISVSTGGLITASATQSAGYVAAGTKSATKQLTVQAAQTITPGTSNKTIASGRYLTGTQTIKGDSNLVAGNIKKGVSIFGVAGSYEGSGGGSSGGVETCTLTIVAPEAPPPPLPVTLIATDGNMNPISIPPTTAGDYKIAKNTLLYFQSGFINFAGSYDAIVEDGPFVVRVTGDCTFEMLG